MEIQINDTKRLEDIQQQFSEHYPYLKLEFFEKPHGVGKPSSRKDKMNKNLTIGQARKIHSAGLLVIHKNQKVSELERDFQDTFGLSVQVFRKSGDAWIETIDTDHWTLREQNKYAGSKEAVSQEPQYPQEEMEREQM